MTHPCPWAHADDCLVLVLVGIAVVWLKLLIGAVESITTAPRPTERCRRCRTVGGRDDVHKLGWDLAEKTRRIRRVILAEDSPPRRARHN